MSLCETECGMFPAILEEYVDIFTNELNQVAADAFLQSAYQKALTLIGLQTLLFESSRFMRENPK